MGVNAIPFFSSFIDEEARSNVLDKFAESGSRIIPANEFLAEAKRDQSLLQQRNYVLIGTGGVEQDVVEFLSKAKLSPPIVLLSYERRNSLPAAMEIKAYLTSNGCDSRIVHAPLDRLAQLIRKWCWFSQVEERIAQSRLGVLGEPSSWLVASHVDASAVRERWGATIERFPLTGLLELIDKETPIETGADFEEFVSSAACVDVTEEALRDAGHVFQAVKRFVEQNRLDAVTVKCFTLLHKTGITGCLALSQINDTENLSAGCEGDIPSTFTMMLVKFLTGQSAFMANVTEVDQAHNSVAFAHCTVPLGIVDSYEITSHAETGKSVGLRGRFKPQKVTIVKVFGNNLSQFWVSGGKLVRNLEVEGNCRTQIRVSLEEPVDYFLEKPLANHHLIVPGEHVDLMSEFLEFVLGP
jgi:L-fucose isomerase-like protein